VLEVRPSVATDKGTAVRALLASVPARRGLYAGDDTTDLDAFQGLAAAGLAHAVRIAVESVEGPQELAAAADLTVPSPEALGRLLATL
jgi:trehalose 6-phosphate phosphatase